MLPGSPGLAACTKYLTLWDCNWHWAPSLSSCGCARWKGARGTFTSPSIPCPPRLPTHGHFFHSPTKLQSLRPLFRGPPPAPVHHHIPPPFLSSFAVWRRSTAVQSTVWRKVSNEDVGGSVVGRARDEETQTRRQTAGERQREETVPLPSIPPSGTFILVILLLKRPMKTDPRPRPALLFHSQLGKGLSGLFRPSLDFLGPSSKRPLSRAHNFCSHSASVHTKQSNTEHSTRTKKLKPAWTSKALLIISRLTPLEPPPKEDTLNRSIPPLPVPPPPPTTCCRLAQLGATRHTRPQIHPC